VSATAAAASATATPGESFLSARTTRQPASEQLRRQCLKAERASRPASVGSTARHWQWHWHQSLAGNRTDAWFEFPLDGRLDMALPYYTKNL